MRNGRLRIRVSLYVYTLLILKLFYFSKEIGFPCEDIQIAITNFDVNEYYIVKTLVQFTGADFVEEMSRKTNIVIAKK